MTPIGYVRGGRKEPRDDGWESETCRIELDGSRFEPSCLAGLSDFSHVEVIYRFHLVDDASIVSGARHPRERTDWPKVGIFAQRGRVRPNRLGVTVCRLLSVEALTLSLQGCDAIDGSPVLDIKPYLSGFAPRGKVVEPPWAKEIMKNYW
jgi:tRNA (Thr-GGU) A37 N-methylase